MGDALQEFDGSELAARIRAGDLHPAEVVEAAIQRIEAANPTLNAVIGERFEAALAEARAGLPDGPFTGVPFLVKDLGAEVAGIPATRGSRLWADAVPSEDGEIVARYRAAGLVVLGTTNTPELGKNGSTEPLLHGPTRNPWRPTHSPGGSSGGSAAAVSSGMVPMAHGNDGGGSIRLPASMCGLFGLKPSRGRVPTKPYLNAFAYPLGSNHALTTTVRDSAALLDVVAGPVAGPAYAVPGGGPFAPEVGRPPGRLRVALSTRPASGVAVDPGCVATAERAAELCRELGHEVELADFDYAHEVCTRASSVVMAVSHAAAIEQRLAELGRDLQSDDLEPFSHELFERGRSIPASAFVAALESVEQLGHEAGAFFERYDILLTPTMAIPVPELGYLDTAIPSTMYERGGPVSAFTSIFNVTGQPGMSVPLGRDSGGMPTGAQFIARFGEEATLLRLAAQLEDAAPWPRHASPA